MSMEKQPKLLLTTSPFLKATGDTSWIMWQVNLALLPVVAAAVYFFGISALLVIAAATAGAAVPEWIANRGRERSTVYDGSAVITGVLLALTLPPAIPLWMAFVGGSIAILLGKLLFGGLGYTVFNPALIGRAFLQAAFPEAMTTWSLPSGFHDFFAVRAGSLAPPFMKSGVDVTSSATPLAEAKFDGTFTDVFDLALGTTSGSLGETAGFLILAAGAYLAVRKIINWRIPVGIFATVFALGALMHWIDSAAYPPAAFHLFSGGLMLGAVFMATDPVTSPVTQLGSWIFAVGIGILVIVIRLFGGLAEGVMYAILFMNAAAPIISRSTQPRTFGKEKRDLWKG